MASVKVDVETEKVDIGSPSTSSNSILDKYEHCKNEMLPQLYRSKVVKIICVAASLACVCIYILIAFIHDSTKAWQLVILLGIVAVAVLIQCLQNSKSIKQWTPTKRQLKCWKIFEIVVVIIMMLLITIVVLHRNLNNLSHLMPVFGLICLIGVTVLTSTSPGRICWRPVVTGFILQFIIGYIVMQTQTGYETVHWIGCKFLILVKASKVGITFVFGELATEFETFVINGLFNIILFYACINILYHWRVIPFIADKIAKLLRFTMGTTVCESLNASSNIFIGMQEALIVVKPYLENCEVCELFATMVGGMCTISGPLLAVYTLMGVSPVHLVTASAMSAPAALAFSKMSLPSQKNVDANEVENMDERMNSPYVNFMDALSQGAIEGLKVIGAIAANLIMVLSLVCLLDMALAWLGSFVGIDLSIEIITGYILAPLAYIIGADYDDSKQVGFLMGAKTIVNEFYAYELLSKNIKNNTLSERSEVVATYALCGFSNLGSVGIVVGGLSTMIPHRKQEAARLGIRAMLVASIACFSTACVAGLLYTSDIQVVNSQC